MPAADALPTYRDLLARVERAERNEGWLLACEREGVYLALCAELVTSLTDALRPPSDNPVLEVCAGRGELADALRSRGITITAVDSAPTPAPGVESLDIQTALLRYRPSVVVGSFVPFDSGVESAVLRFPSTRRYIMLNARLGGETGPASLWDEPGWHALPATEVSTWMITRHDVWVGSAPPLVAHGEAWVFERE